MTQDEIIEMARQAWADSGEGWVAYDWFSDRANALEAFAKLIADKEREACAEIAEKQRYAMNISLTSHPAQNGTAVGILNQIRARGEA
jgi:hypothetical protein